MGHVGNKLLPGIVQHFHTLEQLIESLHDMFRLRQVRDRNALIAVPFLYPADGSGDTLKGLASTTANTSAIVTMTMIISVSRMIALRFKISMVSMI